MDNHAQMQFDSPNQGFPSVHYGYQNEYDCGYGDFTNRGSNDQGYSNWQDQYGFHGYSQFHDSMNGNYGPSTSNEEIVKLIQDIEARYRADIAIQVAHNVRIEASLGELQESINFIAFQLKEEKNSHRTSQQETSSSRPIMEPTSVEKLLSDFTRQLGARLVKQEDKIDRLSSKMEIFQDVFFELEHKTWAWHTDIGERIKVVEQIEDVGAIEEESKDEKAFLARLRRGDVEEFPFYFSDEEEGNAYMAKLRKGTIPSPPLLVEDIDIPSYFSKV